MQANRSTTFHFLLSVASASLLLALLIVWFKDSRQQKPIELIPALTDQPEYCVTCHTDVPEISPSHSVKSVGCVSCHGGERLALDADLAHSAMRGGTNPTDLSVVETSCGGTNCHSGSEADTSPTAGVGNRDHIQRVMTSVQSTYAGAIANIRFTFGAQPDLNAHLGLRVVNDERTQTGITSLAAYDPLLEENPFLQNFGENCLNCHLHSEPMEGDVFTRRTGCAACHSTGEHRFSTAIPYTQCNTCHNRGNYDLRTMTFVERNDHPTDRLHDYYQPIAQFTRCEYTLDCIDCHTRDEVMGDGDIHANKQDIQYIQCKTCHGTPTELPLTQTLTDANDIAFRMAQLNPVIDLKIGDTILITEKGEPLWNTRVLDDGTYEMVGKATKEYFTFRPVMGSACTQTGEDQSSAYCHTCHAVEK